ncbi:hypothetical protein [Bradyrhizobium sp. SYSU BS000235]|uniref:hypothetical protein n=1 Tax=Bradyrhizobium sp. SYSU BS000235 TaxID=3411332 RepID=UPI003C722E52
MLAADFVFLIAVGFVIACNLYFEPRIKGDRIAMQWGLDGKPTWSAPKRWALWGTVALMVIVRGFIWASMTYTPEKMHGAELGLLLFSIIVALSHLFVISKATKET